jgi:hypothetical protein
MCPYYDGPYSYPALPLPLPLIITITATATATHNAGLCSGNTPLRCWRAAIRRPAVRHEFGAWERTRAGIPTNVTLRTVLSSWLEHNIAAIHAIAIHDVVLFRFQPKYYMAPNSIPLRCLLSDLRPYRPFHNTAGRRQKADLQPGAHLV